MLNRRKRQPMTERRKTEFKRHRKFVRGFVCIVPGCTREPIECCHVRKGLPADTPGWARGGTGMKPMDAFCFPGCSYHHEEQHRIGEDAFAAKYKINLLKEALAIAGGSPCLEIREFVRGIR